MYILIGIGAALALLYFWLLCRWFARIGVFLVLAAVGAFFGACLSGGAAAGGIEAVGILLGVAVAWLVAGIPIYIRQYQERRERRVWQRIMSTNDLQPLIHAERISGLLR